MKSFSAQLLAVFFTVLISLGISRGAIVWTNTAGGNWSDPNNWSPNQVPGQLDAFGSPDDVAITAPGTYTVVLDEGNISHSWDIQSLTLGADGSNGVQTLLITNKILYANPVIITGGGVLTNNGSAFHANITITNGGQLKTVNGIYFSSPLTVASGGTLYANSDTFHQSLIVATGGTFTTPGSTIDKDCTLSNAGTVNIPTGVLTAYGPITNSGVISIFSNGGIYVYNNGTPTYQGFLLNLPTGQIDLAGGNGIQGNFGQDSVVNQGVILDTGGGQVSVTSLDNSAGTISNLTANGTVRLSGFTGTLVGQFYTVTNGTTALAGGTRTNYLTPGSPLVLAGPGRFQFQDGNGTSYLDLPSDIVPHLILAGGVLKLEPAFQGGAITNLTLNGTTLTNSLHVMGTFNVTNSSVYGNWTVQSGSVLNNDGGTLHGAVTVAAGGTMNTPGSTIDHDGSLTMNGTLNIPTGVLTLYGPMTNSGVVSIFSNGGIYIYNNNSLAYQGYLLNLPGGLINLFGGNGIAGSFGQDRFANQGTVLNEGGNRIAMTYFDPQSGVITNLSGTLNITGFTTLAGNFYGTNGTTTTFGGGGPNNYLTPGTLTLAGGGNYQFKSGWLDLPTDTISNLDLAGGVLKLEPTFQGGAITNLVLDGMIFTNNLPLSITGNFSTTNGTLAGTFPLNSGGVWNAYVSSIYGAVNIAGGGIFNDYGTPQIYPPGSFSLSANGQLNLLGGDLYLHAPLTNAGTVKITSNHTIVIYDNLTTELGGVVNQPGGIINLLNSSSISGTVYGHEYLLNHGGNIVNGGNSSIDVVNFTNAGTLTTLTGTFQLDKVTLQDSGSLMTQLNNDSDYGKFSISGAAALGGSFGATANNYIPAPNTTFTALSYGSYSGAFNSYNFPAGQIWIPQYNATSFSFANVPQFAATLADTNLFFVANGGTFGNSGILLSSTNLVLPLAQWTPILTNTFDKDGHRSLTNSIDFTKPKQFYILRFQ
jgi:filamentous hemagglutinin